MKKTKKQLDMTQGDAVRLLISFTVPALLGNVLNQVYSITDSIIVGRVLGTTALAAVGVCAPIVFLTAAMVFGLNLGIGIIFAQFVGKKDLPAMRGAYANGIYMGAILAVFMAAVGIPLTVPVLKLMGTPQGPMQQAAEYMRINFATSTFPIYYFLFANIARGLGDSYTPLYGQMVSVFGNILLDYLFVAVMHLGVAGSAWATALAQAFSVVFAMIMLYRKYPEIRLHKKDLRPDRTMFGKIFGVAFPIALQSAFNSFGNVMVQSAINGFGETVMAAYTAASRIGNLALMPVETVGSSLSIFAGQNYGAKKYHRVSQGVKAAFRIDLVISVSLAVLIILFHRPMISLFLENVPEEVFRVSAAYLMFSAVPGILYGMMLIYQQVLRGVNRVNVSVAGGFIQLGTKVILALLGAWGFENLNLVWLAWPVSYVTGTILPALVFRKHFGKIKAPAEE